MNRPSHWILGSFVVFGAVAWWTGALENPACVRGGRASGTSDALVTPQGSRRTASARENGAGRMPVPGTVGGARPASMELHGRVIDRLGYPVANATVRLAGEADATTSDARGRFRLTTSSLLHKRLRIEAPGVHDAIEVPGSLDEIQVVLQDALPWPTVPALVAKPSQRLLFGEGTIRGAGGAHLGDVRVTIRETGAMTQTDGDGRYQLPLDSDVCTLVAFDGQGGVGESAPIEIPKRQGKLPLPELRLAAGPMLRGRVITPDGDPLVDVAVLVNTGGIQRVTRTESGGMFVVAGLIKGNAELTVLPHGGYLGTRRSLLIERDANLEDVTLQRPTQEPLRIDVVDVAGDRQPFVHVVAEQLAGLCRAYGQADAQGQVVLAGLGDGQTEFEVRGMDFTPIPIQSFDAVSHRIVVAP